MVGNHGKNFYCMATVSLFTKLSLSATILSDKGTLNAKEGSNIAQNNSSYTGGKNEEILP